MVPYVALGLIRRALDAGVTSPQGCDLLDCCEIALDLCRQKKRAGQMLKNPAGLLMKIVKDPDTMRRLISEDTEKTLRQRFRQREQVALRQHDEMEKRAEILEYERYRSRMARMIFDELPQASRQALRKEKAETVRHQERFDRLPTEVREREIDELVFQDLARRDVPPFEKWLLRKRAQQGALFSMTPEPDELEPDSAPTLPL